MTWKFKLKPLTTLALACTAVCVACPATHAQNTSTTPNQQLKRAPEGEARTPIFVEVVEFEEIDKLRVQTDATRTTEEGETEPVYDFLEPEAGLSLARLTVSLGTDTPTVLDAGGIQLFLPPDTRFDPVAKKVTGDWVGFQSSPIPLEFKTQIELAFVIPSYAWDEFELFVNGQIYPLEVNRLETPTIQN